MPKLLLLTLIILQFNISALDVRSHYWGFDNTVKENSFNLLTLVVFNDTPEVYDDYISVSEASTINKEVITRRKLFLNSGQKKTIQLSCYIGQNFSNWTIAWKDGRININSPATGDGSAVYLSKGSFN